ncbi:OpgC domain-containing protein [Caulobacter soli]|uniref:OpgC domain-containing protein n=1 Tax=Caulobacter soli TaxID=2708539 RepID=UPI0024836391|nr:OpgC domain-containing protein [Caulobacter soli]
MHNRVHAIDAIRGFCLVNIFVNHITAGILHNASPSNLGFSDSAEIFVFLAGVSTFFAYGNQGFGPAAAALWRRAAKLYRYNLTVIFASLVGLLAIAGMVGASTMLDADFLEALSDTPLAVSAWNIVSLQQSVGYSMVLRLYIALMVMAPVFVWLASRRWWWPLPPAVLIWALAGHFGWVGHDSLTGTPLTLTILPWSLVFACGLAFAAGAEQGVILPRSPLLLGAAVAMVLSYVILLYVLPQWPQGQTWVAERNAHFWLGSSKTYESPLRLLHALSLVYIVAAFPTAPVIRLIHQVRRDNFLARLGRRSLPVFSFGAVYALLGNEILNVVERLQGKHSTTAIALEVVLVAGGLAIMGLIADRRWPLGALISRSSAPSNAVSA